MSKVSKLKAAALVGAGGILGASGGVAATHQIRKNKRQATAKKGWDTRRRMQKSANLHEDSLVLRSIVKSDGSPRKAVAGYTKRKALSLLRKARGKDDDKSTS